MHLLLVLVLNLFLPEAPGRLFNNPPTAHYLFWQKEQPLQWRHFQARPDHNDPVHAAVTYAGIDLQLEKMKLLNGEMSFRASAVFDRSRSWVHPEKKDEQLLAHEQLHFDIAELHARKLENHLNTLKLKPRQKNKVKELLRHYQTAQLEMQEQYDEETLHGLRKAEQERWREKVSQQLQL